MTTGKSNTDKFFREVAFKYEEKPPPYAWKNLAVDLGEKKKRRRIAYFRLAAASIAILIAFSIGYYYSGFKSQRELKSFADGKVISNQKNIENKSENRNQNATYTDDKLETGETSEKSTVNIVQAEATTKTQISKQDKIQYVNKLKKNDNDAARAESTHSQLAQNEIRENEAAPDSSLNLMKVTGSEELVNNSEQRIKQDSVRLDYIPDIIETPEITDPLAQNDMPKENRWSIGGELAPIYSYRSTNSFSNSKYQESLLLGGQQSTDNTTNTYNEAAVVTYSAGINTRYELSPRWSFQSGLYYSKFGQSAEYFDVITQSDQSFSTNTTAGNLPLDYTIIANKPEYATTTTLGDQTYSNLLQYFEYLELPLAIRYKLIDRKIDLNLISGIYTGFLIGNNAFITEDGKNKNIGKTEGINTMIYSTMLGFGIEYGLSKKISLNLEPSFKYSLRSINNDNSYIYKPYSFGIFTGINYKL